MRHGLRTDSEIGKTRPGGAGLSVFDRGISYLFRDLFTTSREAGAVNGSLAEPGPGVRTVLDTGGQITISDGALNVAGVAVNQSHYNNQAITRAAGKLVSLRCKVAAGKLMPFTGLMLSNLTVKHMINRGATRTSVRFYRQGAGGTIPDAAYMFDGAWYEWLWLLRATGHALYQNDGSYPKLVYVGESLTDASLVMGYRTSGSEDQDFKHDNYTAWSTTVPLLALASDSFNRADGALGSTDGAGHAEANSGSGLAWADRIGTGAIATNAAGFSALVGSVGIATVEAGSSDQYVKAKLTRSAGNVGVVFRYVDADNHYRAYHNGTQFKIDSVIGGTVTNVNTTSATYSAGEEIHVKVEDCHITVFYGQTRYPAAGQDEILASDLMGTSVGLYSTDAGNRIDDFVCYPIALNNWNQLGVMSNKVVDCVGDSITAHYEDYERTLIGLLGDGWTIADHGMPGKRADVLVNRVAGMLANRGNYAVILVGINDIITFATADAVKTALQTMYDTAKSTGRTVVAVTCTPFKNYASWDAGRQAVLDEVNAWILNTATNVDYRVDAYTALEDGGAPDALLAAYDSGDHLHPSAAGYAALGTAIYNGATWA